CVMVSEGRGTGRGRVGGGDVCVGGGGWVVRGPTVDGWTVGRFVEGTGLGEWDVVVAVGLGVEGAEVEVRGSGVSDGSALDGGVLGAVAAESGVFPSESSNSHVPVPPRTRTAAPPAIHEARREGRR
ncbi:hypothetical protein, partial [Streptomyces populi]|uniref:hypothetical protein n=1 Tax=Streptomyces populi TaxID=2058924 RepID=UPI0019D00F9C